MADENEQYLEQYHNIAARSLAPFLSGAGIDEGRHRNAVKELIETGQTTDGNGKSITFEQINDKYLQFIAANPKFANYMQQEIPNTKPENMLSQILSKEYRSNFIASARNENITPVEIGNQITELQTKVARDIWNKIGTPKDHVTEIVAEQIKELGSSFGVDPNDNEKHFRIANELITNRQANISGFTLTIEHLDKQISSDPAKKEEFEQKFGTGATVDSIIPTAEKRDAINTAINKAEEENRGMFGASIGNILMGFLSWVLSLFSNDSPSMSIGEHIAKTTAGSVAKDTEKHLAASGLFNGEEITRIKDTIHNVALEKAGFTPEKHENMTDTNKASEVADSGNQTKQEPKQSKEPDKGNDHSKGSKGQEPSRSKVGAMATVVATPIVSGADGGSKGGNKNNKEEINPEKPTEKPASETKTVTQKPKNQGGNLKKATEEIIDDYLNKNPALVKFLGLTSDDISNIKTSVADKLAKNKDNPALSNSDYNGNYQVVAGHIADAIVNDAGIGQKEALKNTPVNVQINMVATSVKEFLSENGGVQGAKLRVANLQDKTNNLVSGIDLSGLGVTDSSATTTLAMWNNRKNSTGIYA